MPARRFYRRAGLRAALAGGGALLLARAARRRDVAALAAGAAATVGASQEVPHLGLPAAAVVARVGAARLRQAPRAALAAILGGAGLALATRGLWPVAPKTPADVRRRHQEQVAPAAGGMGAVITVNASSGSADGVLDELRERLPQAGIVELDDPDDLVPCLERAARDGAKALGAVGGDGTINAAAAVAAEVDLPLVVVPGGTLNHLARDLGVEGVDDAAKALEAGHVSLVDLPTVAGRPFLNTASFGSYAELVDAREELEDHVGKWPAMVVALVRVLHGGKPLHLEVDGKPTRVWMSFVGNCRYQPAGFAPTWRERLDDGLLDVRIVDAAQPFSRSRLVLALLTGRLGSTRVYRTWTTDQLHIRSDEPLRLACDGEVFDGSTDVTIEKTGAKVALYTPR